MPQSESDDRTRTHIQLQKDLQIGHYRIIERIGAGGMGEVYLAEDTELKRKVALKFLPPHLCQDADCRVRFKREAQAAAKLSHSNVVTIFDVSEFQGRPFFAMEYVEGYSLREVIKQGKLSVADSVGLTMQLCEGLQAAHEAGITHRDIKPSNIIIDRKGRAKLLDFGLAAIKGTEKLTRTGSTLGTIGYMSPEQAEGKEVDRRSDIFSLGVVLYEMIAGKRPFDRESDVATTRAIATDTPEPLARYKIGVSDELQRVVNKALEKDLKTRYQHVDDLAADLTALVTRAAAVGAGSARRFFVSAVIIVAILATAIVLKPWRFLSSEASRTPRKRVAVLPFRNQTGDAGIDNLGLMVADWTAQGFSMLNLAEVISTERMFQLGKEMRDKSVAKSTGAELLISGSYYRIQDTILFQAQVADADGRVLQAIEPVKSRSANLMEGVESVRQRVLGALAVAIDERMQIPVLRPSKPPIYEAYSEYIQGLEFFVLKKDYETALGKANRAFALDTSFLIARDLACCASVNLGHWAEADSLAKLLTLRRGELNRTQQLSLDAVCAVISGDWLEYKNTCREMIKLEPDSKVNYLNSGRASLWLNRPLECIKTLSEIKAQDTMILQDYDYWSNLTVAYHQLEQYKEELAAIQKFRQAMPECYISLLCELSALVGLGRIDEVKKLLKEARDHPNRLEVPENAMSIAAKELRAHGYENEAMLVLDELIEWYRAKPEEERQSDLYLYARALYEARRWQEARETFQQLQKLRPDIAEFQYYLGRAAARLGDQAEAMRVSDSLEKAVQPYLFGGHVYCRATISAILGNRDEAVSLAKESLRQGHLYTFHTDFDFESLRDYQPFKKLIEPSR